MTDYDTNSLNQYTTVGPPGSQTSYYYDKNGNLIDVNNGQYVYSYDCENRLIDVNEDGNSVASYSYDYQGRRVSKTVYGPPDMTTKYCYDGDEVIAEYDQNDNTLLRKFVYGPGIDEPICMIDVADGNTVYYYHFDGVGSVIALSDVNSVIVETYSYDVFGEPNRTSSIGNPYLFTGRQYDDETGLYYYRARYYKPAIGRFLQTDIDYIDGLNLYTYCGNNPINYVDPLGRDSISRRYNHVREAVGGFVYLGPWDASQVTVYARETIMWSESHGRRIVSEALLKAVLENPNLSRAQMKLIQGQQEDITNALRHAYFSALLFKKLTENDAEQTLLIHEAVWGGDQRDMEADMWNNAIGMRIGLSKGNIIEDVLKAYREGELASMTGGMMKPLITENKCKK